MATIYKHRFVYEFEKQKIHFIAHAALKAMLSIKTNVVTFVFELVANYPHSDRDVEKLGTVVTDRKYGCSVIRKLEDTKSSLNGIARRDLMTSLNFFLEGLESLYQLFEFKAGLKHDRSMSLDLSQQPILSVRASKQTGTDGRRLSLSRAQRRDSLKRRRDTIDIGVNDETAAKILSHAKARFELGKEKARLASEDESLSVLNRILALKVCMASAILANVENPANSLEMCGKCLKQLLAMPAVAKIFRLVPKRGMTASLKPLVKKQRDNIIAAVCQINHAVFMVTLISGGNPTFWPCVDGDCHEVDPLRDQGLANVLRELKTVHCGGVWSFGKGQDEKQTLDFPADLTTNTLGEFIVADISDIKVFSESGKFHSSQSPCDDDVTAKLRFRPISITTGWNDRIYVLARVSTKDKTVPWVGVYALDRHFDTRHKFPVREGLTNVRSVAMNSYDQLCILGKYEGVEVIDVYQSRGRYIYSFGSEVLANASYIAAGPEGEILVLDQGNQCVHAFSAQGDHVHQFEVQSEAEGALSFSHASDQLAVTTLNRDTEQGKIDIYTREGEFLHTVQLETWDNPGLTGAAVMPDGRFAVSSKLECKVYVI